MTHFNSLFISLFFVIYTSSVALAQPPVSGVYVTREGTLTLNISKDRTSSFKIGTIGANAHYCLLEGTIQGNTGYATTENTSDPKCLVLFTSEQNGINVSTPTEDACRNFCGARAWFEDVYLLPPTACGLSERKATQKTFLSEYRSKNYTHAYDTLNSMYHKCQNLLHWKELDSVRNDLAITQFHLGHKDVCLDILKDTIGARQTNEEMLNQSLPPSDFDSYLPIAEATWHNLNLCGKYQKKQIKK